MTASEETTPPHMATAGEEAGEREGHDTAMSAVEEREAGRAHAGTEAGVGKPGMRAEGPTVTTVCSGVSDNCEWMA